MGNKRMAATVITIAVEKGGCGKTVTTSNLAYLMGDEGKKVLCLDTDPQGNLTFALTRRQRHYQQGLCQPQSV